MNNLITKTSMGASLIFQMFAAISISFLLQDRFLRAEGEQCAPDSPTQVTEALVHGAPTVALVQESVPIVQQAETVEVQAEPVETRQIALKAQPVQMNPIKIQKRAIPKVQQMKMVPAAYQRPQQPFYYKLLRPTAAPISQEIKKEGTIQLYSSPEEAKRNMLQPSVVVKKVQYEQKENPLLQKKIPNVVTFSVLGLGKSKSLTGKDDESCGRLGQDKCEVDDAIKNIKEIKEITPNYSVMADLEKKKFEQTNMYILAPTVNTRCLLIDNSKSMILLHVALATFRPHMPCLEPKKPVVVENPAERLLRQNNEGMWQIDKTGHSVTRSDRLITGIIMHRREKKEPPKENFCKKYLPEMIQKCKQGKNNAQLGGCNRDPGPNDGSRADNESISCLA